MFGNVTLTLLEGFGTTIKLFALTLIFALPLGLIISFGSMSRIAPLRWITRTVVWFHDEQAVAARVRLCAFFGVDSVCLSNLSSVADSGNYSVLRGLKR